MRAAAVVFAVAIGFTGALLGAVPASGERQLAGNLLVVFNGGIEPTKLPRERPAPVSVGVEASFRAVDGSDPPPQLRTIRIGINREGRIFDRGLPTCRVRRIQPATVQAAKRVCGGAIVGTGKVGVRVKLPNQPAFDFSGPLLAFNARRTGGDRRLLAQVYSRRPPAAFVLTFRVTRRPGTFGTVIQTSLPRGARRWAYVTHFEMKLRRTYSWRGKRRSFVSASCGAPAGFPGALFPFARATFGFADGRTVRQTLLRECLVR